MRAITGAPGCVLFRQEALIANDPGGQVRRSRFAALPVVSTVSDL